MKISGTNTRFRLFVNETEPLVKPTNHTINKEIAQKFGMSDIIDCYASKVQMGIQFDDGAGDPLENPQASDFSLIPFRLISATLVGSGTWKSTDFSNANVLKKSIPLLSGKPAYLNHDFDVKNAIGTIGMCEWAPGKGKPGSIDYMPAGIDGPYVIDRKLHGDLVRKLNSPMPVIQSSSVSILFDWESSHEFENESDFYYHVGEMIDGKEVTRVVTNVKGYIESSLVFNGADPFAKIKKKDGSGYVNIPFSAEELKNLGRYDSSLEDTDSLIRLMKEESQMFGFMNFNSSYSKNYLKPTTEEDMFKGIIAKAMGIPEAEVTEEKILAFKFVPTDKFESLSGFENEVVSLKASITEKENELTSLKATITEKDGKITSLETENLTLKATAQIGTEYLTSLKSDTKASYEKMMAGKNIDANIVKEIEESSSVESLSSKFKLFTGEAYTRFGAYCSSCGKSHIEFRRTEPEDNSSKKTRSVESHLEDLM